MNTIDIMTTPVITISDDSTVGEAADIMIERKLSCLPVMGSGGELVGILTHSDFGLRREVLPHGESLFTMLGHWAEPEAMERVTQELKGKLVKEVMHEPVTTVEEDTELEDLLKLMITDRINRPPVMRGEKVVGIITRHDLLKLLISHAITSKRRTPATM